MDWISVKERLPEEKEPVIILLRDGQVFRGEIRERILLPEWWYYYDAGDMDMDILGHIYSTGDGMWIHDNPVIAWMPCPSRRRRERRHEFILLHGCCARSEAIRCSGITGKGEEFYKAVDDFVANECEKRRLEMEAEK